MTFEQWLCKTMTYEKPSYIRLGQHIWNSLCEDKADLINHICNDDEIYKLDPFYVDSRIPAFLVYVQENWDKY